MVPSQLGKGTLGRGDGDGSWAKGRDGLAWGQGVPWGWWDGKGDREGHFSLP